MIFDLRKKRSKLLFAVILLLLLAVVVYGVRFFPKRRLAALTVEQQIEVLKENGARIPPNGQAYTVYADFIHETFADAEEDPKAVNNVYSNPWLVMLDHDIRKVVVDYYGLDVEIPDPTN